MPFPEWLTYTRTIRLANRQLSQDEGVDQRKGGSAPANRKAEREDCRHRHRGVLAQQTGAEYQIANDGFEPVGEPLNQDIVENLDSYSVARRSSLKPNV